jgi:signal transduction histidine kinase
MLSRVRGWINNIPIQHPVDRQMAALLQVILLGFIGMIVMAGVLNLLIPPITVPPSVIIIRSTIFVLIAGVPLFLLRRGALRSPSVYGDRIRLREVLENLIDNAAKYMGDQPDPTIEIGARLQNEEPVIFVKDNGTGIEPKYHTKIFGLFEKLNPAIEGTRIGLALVKRIVETHNGKIWVESEGLGKGSTFCFTIPSSAQNQSSPRQEQRD